MQSIISNILLLVISPLPPTGAFTGWPIFFYTEEPLKICSNLLLIAHIFKHCACLCLHFHPNKCMLFSSEVGWCYRIIRSDGWCFDSENIVGLRNTQPPTTGSYLQQFFCALKCIRTTLPDFARMTSPLKSFLETVYKSAGKRTSRADSLVSLETLGWGATELAALEE